MNLGVSFDGLILKNPLMPASGPLVGDADKIRYLDRQGVGALVTKTIATTAAIVPRPCIYGTSQMIMNSELWSEYTLDVWVEDFLPQVVAEKSGPLLVSVGYTKKDMEKLIAPLDHFADGFEVSTHYVGTDLKPICETVATIRRFTEKPVYLKVSPHMPDPVAFAKAVYKEGASGVVAINSLGPTLNIDLQKRALVYGSEAGTVYQSGPSIHPLALACVYRLKQAMPEMTVIGAGGVMSAKEVLNFLMAGASAVQMLSGALIKGKDLYRVILQDLEPALVRYGFRSIDHVMGHGLDKSVTYEKTVVEVDHEVCSRCGLCERICPYFALTLEDQIFVEADACFGCHLCVSRCPAGAIHPRA